jgi:hypothetical protein
MAGLACPAKPWRGRVPPSTFFLGREARTWPLMQTAPPSRIMLGGAVLNPDSEIPRQLSVCGGAIRFNGRRQLRRPYSSVAHAPWKLLVRGPVHPQLAVPDDLHFEFNTLVFRRHLRIPGVVLLTIETAPTPRIDRPSRCGWSSSAGAGSGTAGA